MHTIYVIFFFQTPHIKPIGHKIQKLREKLDVIVEEGGWVSEEVEEQVSEEVEEPQIFSFGDESGGRRLPSRDENLKTLITLLLAKETNPFVISLFGMGGIGKTFLARKAYNDNQVEDFFDKRMFVCVSFHFDPIRVAMAILESLEGYKPNISAFQTLITKIIDLIRGKKFLLVLDDVWNEDLGKWEPFRLALKFGAPGSKIIVTTRDEQVVKMMRSDKVINLDSLTEEEAWLLFHESASPHENLQQLPELKSIPHQIVKACKGLPLALITLGNALRGRHRDEWHHALDQITSSYPMPKLGEVNRSSFLFAYYNLPLAERRCFTYFAIFPQDEVIVVKDLIQLWMAQGFLYPYKNKDMEKLGYEYIETLTKSGLLLEFDQDKDDKRIISCKLHDLVHSFAQSLLKNEGFATVVDSKDPPLTSLHESTRHLSLKFARQTVFPKPVQNAKFLRTFLILNARHVSINSVLPDWFKQLTCLRALTLSSSPIEKLPNDIGNLMHLRFLNLSSSSNMEELPEVMCNLCNLQSLDVSRCYILEKLPQGMGKLINLRYLNLEGTNFMKMFPKGIGRLKSLRTLTKFIVGIDNDESEGCRLGELNNMNNLEGALEIKGLGNVVDEQDAKDALLEKKKNLHHLCLDFDGQEKNRSVENGRKVLEALKPHRDLKHLEIFGTIVLPKWLMSLIKLEKLKLSGFGQLEPLPPLGKLPSLKTLEILDMNSVKKMGVEFLGIECHDKKDKGLTAGTVLFQKLVSLTFCGLKELEEWDGIGGMRDGNCVSIMPCLEKLTIRDCPKLKALPDFLDRTLLEELIIECCSEISNCNMLLTRLTKLKVLVLKQCKHLEQLPSLGELRYLESLSLWNVDNVKKVGVEFLGLETSGLASFPKLRFLEFWSLMDWEVWDEIGGMREDVSVMPCLQSLIIYNCPKLKSFPKFLLTFRWKELRISGCPILKQWFQSEKRDDSLNVEIND